MVVQYEDMGLNEQMQHRIGNLPAFRIFSQVTQIPVSETAAMYRAPDRHQLYMHPCAHHLKQLNLL